MWGKHMFLGSVTLALSMCGLMEVKHHLMPEEALSHALKSRSETNGDCSDKVLET